MESLSIPNFLLTNLSSIFGELINSIFLFLPVKTNLSVSMILAPDKSIILCAYHVIVYEDFFRSRLHFVIVGVANDDGQGGGAGHGRVSAVLDDDRDLVLLLLLAIERSQRRDDCHTVAVGALC